MTAGRGEGGGRHARPDVPETTGEPAETGPDAPEQGTFGNSVTQPLPMVRREGLGEEPPAVRAVAKRVASALPALGGNEIPDAPPSARAHADRRRRAREAAAGDASDPANPGDAAPAGSDGPTPDVPTPEVPTAAGQTAAGQTAAGPAPVGPTTAGPPSQASVPQAAPPAPSVPGPGPAAVQAVPENPQASVVPRQRTEPRIERAAELVVAMTPAARDDLPNEVELLPVGSRAHHAPVASGAEVSPPPGARQSVSRDAEIVDAEIIDDRVQGRSPVDATAAEVVSALTQVAFRDAQTDEWVTGPSAHLGEVEPVSHLGEVEPVRAHLGELEPVRRGPGVLDSDSWDTTTSLPPVEQDYQGKRRKERRRDPSLRGIVVVAFVVVALSAAVGLPFLMTSNDSNPQTPPVAAGSTSGASRTLAASSPPSPSSTQAGIPVVTAPEASPTPSPSLEPSPGQSASASGSPSPSGGGSPSPPTGAFPLTLQAESASLGGCAQVGTVGGQQIVDRLGESGDWGGCTGHGTATFNNVNLPAGTYRVTVHYVFALRANDDTSRYGRLRIDPDGVGNTTDHWNTYPRTTTCCQTWTTGNVTVSAGTFDISFTHPGNISGPDRAPAIDRIVIARVS